MNGIQHYSVRPNTPPSVNKAIGQASDSSSFGPMMSSALSAAAAASAPTSSAVCAISQEGLSELAKVSRDAYRAADAAVHATTSFVGQAIDAVGDAIDAAETCAGHAVIAGVTAFNKLV
ncbi:hypothetical protein [Aquabacterium sp.]|uniref:hypothetical protein n=1 Tax=Aquabacterium sp. TaxID=1872578 RepID=UPI003D6CDE6C